MKYLRSTTHGLEFPRGQGFPQCFRGNESACRARDTSSVPGSGRPSGEGNPLQYYCLGNPMDRGAWQATIHGATKSQTQLSY